MDLEQLRYPIGRYNPTDPFSEEQFSDEIEVLKDFHSKLEKLVMTLSYDKLQFKYHHMSWSIIQLVHHLSDSHMHAYIRTKNILTNEKPSVQPYDQDSWATTIDANDEVLGDALLIIQGIHSKWVKLLEHTKPGLLHRTYAHPEFDQEPSFGWMIGYYAWHCNHHFAHINKAIESKGKYNKKE